MKGKDFPFPRLIANFRQYFSLPSVGRPESALPATVRFPSGHQQG